MIRTTQQLKATKEKLEQLKKTMIELETSKTDKEPLMYELEFNGLNSLIWQLENEIEEYERLTDEVCKSIEFTPCAMNDFPDLLIKSRLVRNMKQTDLAQKIGVEPQQIQRYEANGYDGVGFARLLEIQYALGLDIQLRGRVMNNEIFIHDESISEEEIEAKAKSIFNEKTLFATPI